MCVCVCVCVCVREFPKPPPNQASGIPNFLYVSLMDAFNPPNLLSCVIGSKKSVLGIFCKISTIFTAFRAPARSKIELLSPDFDLIWLNFGSDFCRKSGLQNQNASNWSQTGRNQPVSLPTST